MKKIISAALVVAMTAASCANKEDLGNNNAPEQPSADGTMTFSADFAEPISKAAPSYNETDHVANVLWEAQDKVGVYDKDGAPAEFTAQTAGESTTLTGFAQPDVATYYAMYPYDENATISGGIISTSLPAEQKAAADAFTAHLAVASTQGNSFSFSNVCGLVRIYVGCEHVTKVEFKGNNNEIVAGDIQVNAATAGYENGAATAKTITVLPPADAQTFAEGAYYFSILPQNFQRGFTVTSYTNDGYTEVRKVDGAVNIPRSSLVVGKPFTDISGTGAEDDPFIIKTVHDLCNLSEELSLEGANYVELANDIDMAGVTEWSPINNSRVVEEIAEIHFEGNNHTISNFAPTTITNGVDGDQASLFGIMYGSCRNLTFENAKMDQPEKSSVAIVAAFAGKVGKGDKITVFENVSVVGEGTIVNGKKVVGGFAASITNATFENCSSEADVTGSDYHVGGFAGRCEGGTVSFIRCFATGDAICTKSKGRCAGGLLGGDFYDTSADPPQENLKVIISNSYATGNVSCAYQAGALVGCVRGETIIDNSYATGHMLSSAPNQWRQYGGIIGAAYEKVSISNCYYIGQMEKVAGEGAGGIVGLGAAGSNVTVSDSFSIADISSSSTAVGGIYGVAKSTASIENCYAAGTLAAGSLWGGILGNATVTDAAVSNCKHNTNAEAVVGGGTVTETNNSKLTAEQASAYATPSAIATQLGWASVQDDQGNAVWNLTGNAPTLRCFE